MKTNTLDKGSETARDIEYMAEMDKLLRELKEASDEVKAAVEGQLREKLKEYRREFGREAAEPYYNELKRIKEAA